MSEPLVEIKERAGKRWIIVMGLGYGSELSPLAAERLAKTLYEKARQLRQEANNKPKVFWR